MAATINETASRGSPQGVPAAAAVAATTLTVLIQTLACVALSVLLTAAVMAVSYGVDDIPTMRVFSSDEPSWVEQLQTNLLNRDLDPRGFYNYGYLYHEVSYYWIRLLEHMGWPASVRFTALAMRSVSLGSYVALLYFVYRCALQLTEATEDIAVLAVVFTASIPELYHWAQMVHPDTLQTALIVLAAAVALSVHTAPGAILASAVAGLAFGVKYGGIFILPFCVLPYLLYLPCSPASTGGPRAKVGRGGLVAGLGALTSL